MLSNSSKYAVKAVLYLAIHSDENHKIMVRDIYEPINVSEAYLAKLLQELSRHKIISSIRGPKGGFYLTEQQKQTSLLDIVKVIDGEKRVHSCILGISECDVNNPCMLHELIGPSKSSFLKILESTTVYDLVHDIESVDAIFPS